MLRPTWTTWGHMFPPLPRGRAAPQTAGRPCWHTAASGLPRPAAPSAPSRCPDPRGQWRDSLRALSAAERDRYNRCSVSSHGWVWGGRRRASWTNLWTSVRRHTKALKLWQRFYITLAGLIPVPLPLAARFWISCIWQILSFSSSGRLLGCSVQRVSAAASLHQRRPDGRH